MCCGNGGPSYSSPSPLIVGSTSRGSSRGVIKAVKPTVSEQPLEGVNSLTPSEISIPVVGESGPTPKNLETADE